jgi:hypothetical protein
VLSGDAGAVAQIHPVGLTIDLEAAIPYARNLQDLTEVELARVAMAQ